MIRACFILHHPENPRKMVFPLTPPQEGSPFALADEVSSKGSMIVRSLLIGDSDKLSAMYVEGWKIERVIVQRAEDPRIFVSSDKEQANSAYGKFAESDEKRLCPKCKRISFHFERCQYLDCGYQPAELVK